MVVRQSIRVGTTTPASRAGGTDAIVQDRGIDSRDPVDHAQRLDPQRHVQTDEFAVLNPKGPGLAAQPDHFGETLKAYAQLGPQIGNGKLRRSGDEGKIVHGPVVPKTGTLCQAPLFRFMAPAHIFAVSYIRNMASTPAFDWYIAAWLASLGMTQSELQRRAGWSKRKASNLVSGAQPFNRHSLNEAARATNLFPYELLMHPEEANAIRRMRASAVAIAAESHSSFAPAPDPDAPLVRRKIN